MKVIVVTKCAFGIAVYKLHKPGKGRKRDGKESFRNGITKRTVQQTSAVATHEIIWLS